MPKIYRMRDKSDKFTVDKGLLPDLSFRMLLIMRTRGGKTNLIANLLLRDEFNNRDFRGEDIHIFSPVTNDSKMETVIEEKLVPDENIHHELDNEALGDLYEQLVEDFRESVQDETRPRNKLIVMDDISYSGALRKGHYNMVNKVFMNGRKHSISILVCSQFYNHISPAMRSQASCIIVGNQSDRQLENVVDDNNYLESKRAFRKMFREEVVEKHDFLVICYSNSRRDMYLDSDFEVIRTTPT